ncbi:unnamed protein product [Diamesa hyperborea]
MGFSIRNLLQVCLLVIFVNESLACQGHKVKLNFIKNCGDAQVIIVSENATLKLNKDCELIPNACVEITKDFTSANTKFTVWKNGLVILKGDVDTCEKMSNMNPAAKAIISVFGAPDHCPMQKMKICEDGSKKASMSEYKNMLTLARGGPIKIKAETDHGSSGKTCLEAEFEIVKK